MASFDFEQAYDEHAWRLFGFFAHRLASSADAEDLTQTTFERALAAWHSFDPSRASIGTWLFTIARNLLIDHHRAAAKPTARGVAWDEIDPGSEPRVGGPEENLGLSPDLAVALQSLSDREREVLALRFGADLTGPEIASTLGLSLANVQQIVSRALRKLRAELQVTVSCRVARADEMFFAQNARGPTPANPRVAKASNTSPQAE